ncbi:DUF779 domain-containing protein [Nocardia jinanensis]|uniref:Uncharacterized protein n=1 Tax=Nocardia jinanensis TaxID=382504 RepID=A0A917R6P2_9NOCA|nr:DUF779 domain-containing protein [Nocardia jinanensis]GGK91446.1 hypothetical protein GCM10011588_02200 [Nocardia jinanensis]
MAYRSDRVAVTDRARNALRDLIEQHGPILLYLPHRDSTDPQPDWLPIRDFRAAEGDTLFGRLAWHTELWMSAEAYTRFEREHLTVDVPADAGPAPGSESNGGPSPEESATFLLRARRLSAAETAALDGRKRGGRGAAN